MVMNAACGLSTEALAAEFHCTPDAIKFAYSRIAQQLGLSKRQELCDRYWEEGNFDGLEPGLRAGLEIGRKLSPLGWDLLALPQEWGTMQLARHLKVSRWSINSHAALLLGVLNVQDRAEAARWYSAHHDLLVRIGRPLPLHLGFKLVAAVRELPRGIPVRSGRTLYRLIAAGANDEGCIDSVAPVLRDLCGADLTKELLDVGYRKFLELRVMYYRRGRLRLVVAPSLREACELAASRPYNF